MKITVKATELLPILRTVSTVVERKPKYHAILSHVHLAVDAGALTISGTDLDVTYRASVWDVDGAPREDGAITVSAKRLMDVCKGLPKGAEITLATTADGRLRVTSGSMDLTLETLPATDYPVTPCVDSGPMLSLTYASMRQLIARTRFAVSTEGMRLQLQGVLLKPRGPWLSSVEMVATDGHRLAVAHVDNACVEDGFPATLIPSKALDTIDRLKLAKDTRIAIKRGETSIIEISAGEQTIFAKLDERRFPDYEKIVSREHDIIAVVPREALAASVKRIGELSGDRMKAVTLTFSVDILTVSSESDSVGNGSEVLPVRYASELYPRSLSLRLNARYVQDYLAAVDAPDVRIALKDEQAQMQVRPLGADDSLYVVMPLRV